MFSKKDIEQIVLKNFVRALKENGLYLHYRAGVDNKDSGLMKYIIKRYGILVTASGPFSKAKTTDDVCSTLKKITREMISRGKITIDDDGRINMSINHLLHFFLENNNVPMATLIKLGDYIYDLSYNKLFDSPIEHLFIDESIDNSFNKEMVNQNKNCGVLLGPAFDATRIR